MLKVSSSATKIWNKSGISLGKRARRDTACITAAPQKFPEGTPTIIGTPTVIG